MSVAVDSSNSLDAVESANANNQPRQIPQDPFSNERAGADRPASAEKSKSSGLDSAFSETIRLAQLGDPSAFEIIYQQYASRVYALCIQMRRDPVEA